jgi:hypothetical protein
LPAASAGNQTAAKRAAVHFSTDDAVTAKEAVAAAIAESL